ncbi:MAG: energy-coupling factor transporter ATPase [Spirochaetae bacterium HGW-Spirochaetae-3]|jgi:energy-coupling factor transport system ATP-binding protein|nr:MAG: energy-coupling factor transporter ATPase [Spirochaetae bacterium HGW-Spirochaetae-3]
MAIIGIDSLGYTYPGSSEPALSDISLDIDEGDYVAIVGANGSGKSTLVRCLNGLLQPEPGTVRVAGADPSDPKGRVAARKALSLVFQSPPDQIVASVVEEDVAFGLENLGVPRPEMRERVLEALDRVDLLAERARAPRFLSAGQQQRLAVAGAIAMRPRIVAFDEATSMIDPVGRKDVLALMDDLVASGIAVIHVTHDMDEAARARRVAVLSEGRLVFVGTPAELFASDRLDGLRLGRPRSYAAALRLGIEPIVGEDAAALGARAVRVLGAAITVAVSEKASAGGHATGGDPIALADEAGAAFSLRDASMSYSNGAENQCRAVDCVSMDVPAGTVVALVGKTGSGKSSLLQLLDGLALPDSGSALSFGVDTAGRKADLRTVRMRAPLAVQRPESAIFEPYSGDEVAFGPRNQGLSGERLVERVRAAMDAAGLPFDEYRDKPSRTLSGGRKRRLAIASILSLDPDALLLDEPTSALDPASRDDMLRLIRGYASGGRTVVMSTHSMDEAASADRVAVMRDGRLEAYGPPDFVFGTGWDSSWGIERPFAFELDEALIAGGRA